LSLEATGNAAAIARILALHVARMVVANPRQLSGVVGPRAKTDRLDARALARLLAGGI
jgi:transposase